MSKTKDDSKNTTVTLKDLQELGILPKNNDKPTVEASEEQEPVVPPTEAPKSVKELPPTPQQQVYDRHVKRASHAQSIFSDLLRSRLKNANKAKDLSVLVDTAFDLADEFQNKLDIAYRKELMELQMKSYGMVETEDSNDEDEDDD